MSEENFAGQRALQGQIAKLTSNIENHKDLIQNSSFMSMLLNMFEDEARRSGDPDYDRMNRVCKNKIKYSETHIKHFEYVIKLFNAFNEELQRPTEDYSNNIKDLTKVVIPLIKINVQDMENCMRELVEDDLFSEQYYKEHMEGLMKEINAWERTFTPSGIVW